MSKQLSPRKLVFLLSLIAIAVQSGRDASCECSPPDQREEIPFATRIDVGQTCSELAFSPDGRTILATGHLANDDTIGFWDVTNGKLIADCVYRGLRLAVSPGCDRLAFVTETFESGVPWQIHMEAIAENHQLRKSWVRIGAPHVKGSEVGRIAFSQDGRKVAYAQDDERVQIWEAATGKELSSFAAGVAVHYSLDGKELLAVGRSGGLRRFEAATGKPLTPLLRGKNPDFLWTEHVAFSADGRRIAISDDYTLLVKDATMGETLARIETDGDISQFEFSPDRRTLVMHRSGCLVFLDSETFRERGRIYPCHQHLGAFAFSADGNLIAWSEWSHVGGNDGVIYIRQSSAVFLVEERKRARTEDEIPLKVELVAPHRDFVLDRHGKSIEQYGDYEFKNGFRSRPSLDWSLRFTNVGKEPMTLRSIDRCRPSFYLIGPGAVNQSYSASIGEDDWSMELAAGQSQVVRVTSLDGFLTRRVWVAPGRYTVRGTVEAWLKMGKDSNQNELLTVVRSLPTVEITVSEKK